MIITPQNDSHFRSVVRPMRAEPAKAPAREALDLAQAATTPHQYVQIRTRLTRSEQRFRIQHATSQWKRCILFTVTFPEANLSRKEASKRLNHFWTIVSRSLRVPLSRLPRIRVAQMHPGGHGIHFHYLLPRTLPARKIWAIARHCRLGHIDFQRVSIRRAIRYVSRYLTKDEELPLPPGTRRIEFAGFQKGGFLRVRDMVRFWSSRPYHYTVAKLASSLLGITIFQAYSKFSTVCAILQQSGIQFSSLP